jgi:hypothetical protein
VPLVAQGLESGILSLFGPNAPSSVGAAEAVSTFLTVATGPLLWVVLFDPSRALTAATSTKDAASARVGRAISGGEAPQVRAPALDDARLDLGGIEA